MHAGAIEQDSPWKSGKHILSGEFIIFSSNKSFLFRNSMIDVSVNHLLLQIESNNFILSIIRFYKKKLHRYSDMSYTQW